MIPRLNLIGAGRVGATLARLWHDRGVLQLQGVLTRSPGSAREAVVRIGAGQAVASLDELPPADLWLLAVPDQQIATVAQALADSPAAPAMAWHASGFLGTDVLAPLARRGWTVASVHPALSFASIDAACAQFPGTVCALQGDAAATQAAERWMRAIGGHCLHLTAADKPLYHAAAVFSSNFLPVLQAVGTALWQDVGVSPPQAQALAQGFVQRVAANVHELGPRAALTGPAARGDHAVVQAQAAALSARDPALGAAYAALSTLAERLAQGEPMIQPAQGEPSDP